MYFDNELNELNKSAMVSEAKEIELPIPLEAYRLFGLKFEGSTEADMNKLKDVYRLAGDVDLLAVLTHKLGAPSVGQSKLDRVWEWLRVNEHIDDLRKQQDALVV